MVKTLTEKFKISKVNRGKKLDLVSTLNQKDYDAKFNEVYSTAQRDREKYERLLNIYSDGNILKQEKKNYGFSKGFRRAIGTLTAIAGLTFMGCPVSHDSRPSPETPIEEPTQPTTPTEPHNPSVPVEPEEPTEPEPQEPTEPVKPEPQKDYVDISGRVEDCENDGTGRNGYIVVKNKTNNSVIGTYPVNGNFSFRLPKLISELPDGIILEARLGTENSPTSYKRTIELPAGDHNPITDPRGNPAIRCAPFDGDLSYDDGLINSEQKKADFKEHMGRVNFGAKIGINPVPEGDYLKKWNHGEISGQQGRPIFQGIEIDPHDFNESDYNSIVTAIRKSGHIDAEVILIAPYGSDTHKGKEGGGNILRTSGKEPYIVLNDGNQDGYIERFTAYINTTNEDVVNHELFHGLVFPGHSREKNESNLFNDDESLMIYTGPKSPAKRLDVKANYIIDEPTYLGMEKLDDILGL